MPDDNPLEHEHEAPENFFRTAIQFELGLGVLALILAWIFGQWTPFVSFESLRNISAETPAWIAKQIGWGLLATCPMLAFMGILERFPIGNLKEMTTDKIAPMFSSFSLWQMLAVAVSAGVGEELLFRWFIQQGIAEWIATSKGWLAGLWIASCLFGACHWINATYAVITIVIGIYLGWMMLATGSIIAPMIAHGLYDLIALVYLKWQYGESTET